MVRRLFDLEGAPSGYPPSLQSDIALKSFLMVNSIRSEVLSLVAVYSIVLLVFLFLKYTLQKKRKKQKVAKCTGTAKSQFNLVIHKILSFKPSDSDARRNVSFLRSLCIDL